MLTLTDYDHDLVSALVREFVDAVRPGQEHLFSCVYRSEDLPDQHQVFLIAVGEDRFALKLDTASGETGRLAREFAVLERLAKYFEGSERSDVIHPVYLSPTGQFFVTEYVDRKMAKDVIYEMDEARAGQAFRRAGAWLNDLHAFRKPERAAFYPNWMVEEAEALVARGPLAEAEDYRPMLRSLVADAKALEGAEESHVFSHGDFHSRNLILGPGKAIGLDFADAGKKLAVYDIADFLKSDAVRPAAPEGLDRSGISQGAKEMFFRQYRHEVNPEILDLCLRGRLLIDWLAITPDIAARTAFQRRKFELVRDRLTHVFRNPICEGGQV